MMYPIDAAYYIQSGLCSKSFSIFTHLVICLDIIFDKREKSWEVFDKTPFSI